MNAGRVYSSFGSPVFRPTFPIHDANGDGYITEYDFTLMAQQNGWGQAGKRKKYLNLFQNKSNIPEDPVNNTLDVS